MVIGEFGGLKPGDDNPPGAPHNRDVDPQKVGQTLLEHVADSPPLTLQEYLTEQQKLATEADHLHDLLKNSPPDFVHDVIPFLNKEIALGNVASHSQNQRMSQDQMMNFSMQAGIGQQAAMMKQTLETQGAGALKDPGIHQSVEMFLKQADWVVGRQ